MLNKPGLEPQVSHDLTHVGYKNLELRSRGSGIEEMGGADRSWRAGVPCGDCSQ